MAVKVSRKTCALFRSEARKFIHRVLKHTKVSTLQQSTQEFLLGDPLSKVSAVQTYFRDKRFDCSSTQSIYHVIKD